MTIAGDLTVSLAWNGQRVTSVGIRSTRPFVIARMLAGKTAASAAATVPMLYAVCGEAQRAAAVNALVAAGASDVAADPVRDDERVMLETVQEHFWRLLIDWPQALDRPAQTAVVAQVRNGIATAMTEAGAAAQGKRPLPERALGIELGRLAAESIYGMPPVAFAALTTLSALESWTARGATASASLLGALLAAAPERGRGEAKLMPSPTRKALLAAVAPALAADPEFARSPTWHGAPVETGALARTRSHSLVAALVDRNGHAPATRFVARLVDLALLLAAPGDRATAAAAVPRVQAFPIGEAHGFAAVETARGLLVHSVRIAEGRIADYRIVAPTEWNFHPDGALVCGLEGLSAPDPATLRQQAQLAVTSLDPCVAWRVEVGDA
jgi:hypothetical protein